MGLADAISADHSLWLGVNTHAGHVTYEAVARDLQRPYRELSTLL
jgi:alanine dehydrogenase